MVRFSICIFSALFLGIAPVFAQSNISSVLDGSGDYSSGGGLTNISAAGQPGGISVSSDGSLVNYAGFLNTFASRPALDTDGDGLVDEFDSDNDNDALADLDEITGAAFEPQTVTDLNNPDSDGDGVLDGGEAIAGTDPGDINANLRILDIRYNSPDIEVDYLARAGASQGKSYVIYAENTPQNVLVEKVFTNDTPAGGAAPWYVVTNTFVQTVGSLGTDTFYAVEAVP